MELQEGDRLRVKVDGYVVGDREVPRGTVVIVRDVVEDGQAFVAETERGRGEGPGYRLVCRGEDVGTSLAFLSRGCRAG